MNRSLERFLTTHTGSLPRPDDLIRMMFAKEEGIPVDRAALAGRIRAAVAEVVGKQSDAGIAVPSDGEVSKPSHATYVKDRLDGFGGTSQSLTYRDLVDFPEMAKRVFGDPGRSRRKTPACTGPIGVRDPVAAQADVLNLRAAVGGAGFILQVDCPDLAMGRHIQFADKSVEEFRKMARLHVEALDHALRNIPPEQVRMHLCWGNYEGPHHHDVPLADILDIAFAARPQAVSFEAANPRHAHEWKVFEQMKVPADKIIIPGVIDSTTNFIEHPELVAERIGRYARLVGRENVMAGTDCGFGTWVGQAAVDPDIVWAKLATLAEGARLASDELW